MAASAMNGPTLWDFDGETYERDRDRDRLSRQLVAVRSVLSDYEPHTLAEIAARIDAPEASVSARIRDLRKPRFGGHVVEREYVERGLFTYRLRPMGER
jgi:hypothetical protein